MHTKQTKKTHNEPVPTEHHAVKKYGKAFVWFSLGVILGFFFFVSFLYIGYKQTYEKKVYIGIMVDGVDFSGKSQADVRNYFAQKNELLRKTTLTLKGEEVTATVSAKDIGLSYDENLLAKQAVSIGKTSNALSDMSVMFQAYTERMHLPATYHYDDKKLDALLLPIEKKLSITPVEPMFTMDNNKVIAFKLSKNGREVDSKKLKKELFDKFAVVALTNKTQHETITIPLKEAKPEAEDKAREMGLLELLAQGSSQFQGSIENRVFNIGLAASRLNGTLIPPGETFSFTKTLGDVSSFSGYRQAYVIENGKTVLGDGGGVCQVSTTLFRAALYAGLPIVERNPHAYRVGYYEQDSGPGIDAAIYSPSVDLKFKNDTQYYILIQTFFDPNNRKLFFSLFGTKDNRQVSIGTPVILSETPAPETLYQDDPTLPKGEVKQVDFAAAGANVYFTRTVKRDNKVLLSDKFVSNYRPWQAIYMRGTKE